MIVAGEIWALVRLARLGQRAARAIDHGDNNAAERVSEELDTLYRGRTDKEWEQSRLSEYAHDIMTASERELM